MGAEVKMRTPLPKSKLFGCMLVMLTVSFQLNVIWPFLPFLVDHVRGTSEGSGFYVGVLASMYFWAQFLSAFVWGVMPGILGYRNAMVFSSFAVGTSLIMFGISSTFEEACLWRVVGGLVNGNMPLVKAYLATITDGSNQAKGMSVLSFSWGIGGLVAPAVGGLLSTPLQQYPGLVPAGSMAERIFAEFPYLLPCLAAAAVCYAAGIGAVLLFDSASVAARKKGSGSGGGNSMYGERDEEDDEMAALVPDEEQSGPDPPPTRAGGADNEARVDQVAPSYYALLCKEQSSLACTAYAFSATNFVVFDEMLPLFCKAEVPDGGLGWNTSQIGLSLSIGGLVLCFYQPIIYPRLAAYFGVVNSYRIGAITFTCVGALFSLTTYIAEHTTLLWASMAVLRALYVHAATCMFIGSSIVINNSSELHYVAKVNGIGQAVGSLTRALFPTLAGAIWAATFDAKESSGWLLHPHGVYLLLLSLNFAAVWNAWRLPQSFNRPRGSQTAQGC